MAVRLSYYQLRPLVVAYCSSNCGFQRDHTCFTISLVQFGFLTCVRPIQPFKARLLTSAKMRTHLAKGHSSFTISVVYGIFASFSISPPGGLCGLTCNPSPVAPVQELVHRSTVVFEGKLHDEGRARDINKQEREYLLNQRDHARRNDTELPENQVDAPSEAVPNGTALSEPHQVRIKVHRVWEMKAGGLEKDSIVFIVWDRGDNCLTLSKDTRYMFFMEPTNDTLVFSAMFPPVETRRAIRKDVSKVLCKECGKWRRIGR